MRGHLMSEELSEFLEAMADGNLVQVLHELEDCEVVQKGSVRCLGLASVYPEGALAIHNANMSKLGPDGRPLKNAAGRILKGPNFKKADLTDLIDPAYRQANIEKEVET
jgi:predicted HAD superfamily Cof-like phosphohydrolase